MPLGLYGARQIPSDFFSRRTNMYCPAMRFAADVNIYDGSYQVDFGTPWVADVDGLLDGVDTSSASSGVTFYPPSDALLGAKGPQCDAPFGRNVTIRGAASGAMIATVYGYDYLGQPMVEAITCSSGDGDGKKAFKYVWKIVCSSVNGDNNTDFGWGDVLGLPYKSVALINEVFGGAVQSAGTFVAAVITDPATATTGDPRGTYNPTGTLDGSTRLVCSFKADGFINSSGNGGLHGIKQYTA